MNPMRGGPAIRLDDISSLGEISACGAVLSAIRDEGLGASCQHTGDRSGKRRLLTKAQNPTVRPSKLEAHQTLRRVAN